MGFWGFELFGMSKLLSRPPDLETNVRSLDPCGFRERFSFVLLPNALSSDWLCCMIGCITIAGQSSRWHA